MILSSRAKFITIWESVIVVINYRDGSKMKIGDKIRNKLMSMEGVE